MLNQRPLAMLMGIAILLLGLALMAEPVGAVIRYQTEQPGQSLIQVRHTLQDQDHQAWQAILFKRISPDGKQVLNLRLVPLAAAIAIKHPQPLLLNTSLGESWLLPDISTQISTDPITLMTVGQYDLQSVIPELRPEIPLRLVLTTVEGDLQRLSVPAPTLQEWMQVAHQP